MRRIDLRGRTGDLRSLVPRAGTDVESVLGTVRPICDDVRRRGVDALIDYTARYDGVDIADIRVSEGELKRALGELDPAVRTSLEVAIDRARRAHEAQRRPDVTTEIVPGGTVTHRWVPVRRVGLYVPGGRAVYPSSVVMNVVPAQAAGVGGIAVASPPQRDNGGLPDSTIMATCALLGVTEVYAVGGAQAIAMFAYGAAQDGAVVCPPADLVTGPGNVYVAAAKRLLKGIIGTDAEAGPTEIAIVADDSADPVHVAADLISQAEHDPLAASVLITESEELATAVEAELDRQVAVTLHVGRIREALAGMQSAIILVGDVDHAIAVADAYAAEHLEIQTRDAADVAARVRNAGAIFVGPWSPVSLGDYAAGSNHVLPTGGCARHSSGLSVATFMRASYVVEYGESALRDVADHVVTLAEAETLPAHGAAVQARFPR